MPVVRKEDWSVEYGWSESSGLKLGVCEYQGARILHDAAVPFVYVNYAGDSSGPFTDELRSTSTRIKVREIMFGFDLKVTYDHYGPDYEYEHVWRFLHDGQFGSKIIVHGPGEEIDGEHVYHIPFRFDIDLSGSANDSFEKRGSSGRWSAVAREGGHKASRSGDYQWRVRDRASDRSALVRPGVGDRGEIWALAYSDAESWSSWGGAQDAAPGSPGSVPAVYTSGESVTNADLVLWYIAHLPSGDLPRACGPWLRLQGFPPPEEEEEEMHHDHPDH